MTDVYKRQAQSAPDSKLQHGAGLGRPYREIIRIKRILFLKRFYYFPVVEIENGAAARTEAVNFFSGNLSFKNVIDFVPELILLFPMYDGKVVESLQKQYPLYADRCV